MLMSIGATGDCSALGAREGCGSGGGAAFL